MKLSTVSALALAITPALSAAIGDVTPRATLSTRLFGDAHDFPDKVKCPETDAGDDKEFEKDQMEKTAKEWKDKLNNKKKITTGDQKQGYPARYAIGSENGNDDAKKFWENTKNMKFSDECMKGYIWEVPLLKNGKEWSTDGNNGDAGPYRLYFLAKDGEVKFCGSAIHVSNDRARGSEFKRCEPDD
ncbi:hypothetical protein JX265_012057 [Neoarthrinium moseri]|uniref:Uncharacterized protein n=1 Tax=Neoarthrinium moseri TaxID=1658444 RepID=A0A9P9WBJ7_9PEZI|nr:uncharacterized protein JN550_005950 [Neoarthrinium moseri]KAI1842928.1 hypothetical protein JX266_010946 [Neoarthrinium moseri]KAI1855974.1 hypothetical protein JX265_012057 [Neoarthrinium moseri]KAI1869320.1 hypothetical protein JN550_005950 [Neoarthrinium moseri]